ncbi:MAG: hypothetical protein K2I28_08850, partial [Muribaculaceae bacterium]|nr:hypothetical protein [Muribaculaceae bacterium]
MSRGDAPCATAVATARAAGIKKIVFIFRKYTKKSTIRNLFGEVSAFSALLRLGPCCSRFAALRRRKVRRAMLKKVKLKNFLSGIIDGF